MPQKARISRSRYNVLGQHCITKTMLKQTLFTLILCVAPIALAQTAPEITVEHGVAMKTRDGVTLRADIYRPAGDGKYPGPAPAHSLRQERRRRLRPQRRRPRLSWSSCRTSVVATPPRASGIPSSTRPTTDTTPSSGPPHSRIPTAKSACSADRTSELRRCSPPSATRRISPASVPSSLPAITTKTGPTRAAHSSSGSTSHGLPGLRRTPSTAPSTATPTPSRQQRFASHAVSRIQYFPAANRFATHAIPRTLFPRLGSPTLATTATGNSGPSKRISRTSRSPRSP